MQGLVRLWAALAAAVWPVLSLAQPPGHDAVWDRGGYKWVWIVAAAVVVIALYQILTSRRRTASPSLP